MSARSLQATGALFALTFALAAQHETATAPPTAIDARALAARLGTDAAAVGELFRLGKPAVAALVPLLQQPTPWGEQQTIARTRALALLRDLGPLGGDAIDPLLDCLDREDWREQQKDLLTAIGAIGPWLDRRADISLALGNRCDKGKYFGVGGFFEALSRLTFDPTADRATLLTALEHPNAYVRALAAEALARDLAAHRPDDKAAKALGAQLRAAITADVPTQFHLDWRWNNGNANTGGGIDEPQQVPRAIAAALAVLEPGAAESLQGHLLRLQHSDPHVRIDALRALGSLGDAAADAVEPMIQALRGGDPQVAREAATMLGLLGKAAAAARDALTEASKSDDKQLAARAAAALKRL